MVTFFLVLFAFALATAGVTLPTANRREAVQAAEAARQRAVAAELRACSGQCPTKHLCSACERLTAARNEAIAAANAITQRNSTTVLVAQVVFATPAVVLLGSLGMLSAGSLVLAAIALAVAVGEHGAYKQVAKTARALA